MYKNLTQLLPKIWSLLLFVGFLGGVTGFLLKNTYEMDIYGFEIILGLYSIGIMWGGLVVGFNIKQSIK